ncbi:hypothetical protein HanIR_Chr13g0636031 [Helianthus annuus]|nr:hypothetical protein HanIR_Chr13g0636031 [Helianthus annuus]
MNKSKIYFLIEYFLVTPLKPHTNTFCYSTLTTNQNPYKKIHKQQIYSFIYNRM